MKLSKIILLLFISTSAFAQPFTYNWATAIGGRSQYQGEVDMVYSDFGLLYVTGDFQGTRNFGATTLAATGYNDVYVALCDTSGSIAWAIKGGSPFSYAFASCIAIDNSSNIYVAGYFVNTVAFNTFSHSSSGQNDIFIAKLDFAGNAIWLNKAGGTSFDEPAAIYCDNSHIYLTGSFTNTATFGSFTLTSSGSNDKEVFVAKYDLGGTCIWAKSAGGSGDDRGYDIAKDYSNNLAVSGYFNTMASFGSNSVTSIGFHDAFIAKYDDNGNNIWVSRGGSKGNDIGKSVGFDQFDNYYVAGDIGDTAMFGSYTVLDNGYGNVYVSKYNSSGVCQWARGGGSSSGDGLIDLSVRPDDGNCYVTGFINGSASFGSTFLSGIGSNDVFVLRYNSSGNIIFGIKLGGTNYDQGKAIAADEGSGVIYLSGEYSGTVNIGTNSLPVPPAATWYQFITKIGTGTVSVSETNYFDQPLNIYPNPVSESMTISLDADIHGESDILITDAAGKPVIVFAEYIRNAAFTVPLKNLAAGKYNISIRNKGSEFRSGFIVIN